MLPPKRKEIVNAHADTSYKHMAYNLEHSAGFCICLLVSSSL